MTDTPDAPRYELLARLTLDTPGEVLLARDRSASQGRRLVALERVPPRAVDSAEFVDAVIEEARALSRLRHPNVLRIRELDQDERTFYLATDYAPGCTLGELALLTRERGLPLPAGVVVGAMVQGLRGLHAAHELRDRAGRPLGLVHGSVSARHLLLNPRGEVKLFGFGLGKSASSERERRDRRDDLREVGVVLWELLTGLPLPDAGEVPRLRDHVAGAAVKLQPVLDRSLAAEREDRYATARAMAEALRHFAVDLALDIGTGTVGRLVADVAGERLAARAEAAEAALRAPPSDAQRRALVFGLRSGEEPEHHRLVLEERSLALAEGAPPASLAARLLRRRRWLVAAAVVALLFAAVVKLAQRGYFESDAPPTGVPLRVTVAPTAPPELLRAELEPLRRYLERELDRPVALLITGDYRTASDHLVAGEADAAVLPAYTFAATRRANPRVDGLAAWQVDGAKQVDGLLLVRDDSPARRIDDLQGASFCLPDPDSAAGNLLPRAYLRNRGHDPDLFLGEVRWSGDELSVLDDLLAGRCEVGATSSGALLSAQLLEVPVSRLRRLAITGSAPHPVWATAPSLDPGVKVLLRQALLELDVYERFGAERLGRAQRITGFAPPVEADYLGLPVDEASGRPAAAIAAEDRR